MKIETMQTVAMLAELAQVRIMHRILSRNCPCKSRLSRLQYSARSAAIDVAQAAIEHDGCVHLYGAEAPMTKEASERLDKMKKRFESAKARVERASS